MVGLTAGGSNPELFARQVAEFAPAFSGLGEEPRPRPPARPCDVVLNGITGAVGLRPTLAALEAGTTLALANKESLIMGGPLVLDRAKPGQIVPVDSEHCALAQCLRGGSRRRGTPPGADRERRAVPRPAPRADLADVTRRGGAGPPHLDMGPVITINSATLVNKGLEVIEAHLLFGIPFDRIEVVVHPTSVVHSMVEFVDGSTLVQASPPTMLIPIALGLAWPDRVPDAAPAVDWTQARDLGVPPARRRGVPRGRAGPRRPGSAAAPRPPSTTPPTRCASRPSVAGGLRVRRHRANGRRRCLRATTYPRRETLTVDDVLAADAWARDAAARD